MSRRRPKPDSSVAVIASTTSAPAASSPSVLAIDAPATAAVPCPMTYTRRIVPSASRSAMSAGRARPPTAARSRPPSSVEILPRNVLAKLSGDSLISLSRKCGASPRSMSRVVTSVRRQVARDDRERRAVVGEPRHAVERAGAIRIEADQLPAGLAVEAQVVTGLLDDPVGLAGDDEAVLGEADVDTLSAAAQGEQHPPGGRGRHRPDRHRPLEPTHRAPERLDEGVEVAPAGAEGVGVVAEQGGDHLGVGGDRTGEAQLVLDLEVGVVVDVAVEHADAIRPFALDDLVAVHGMGVGLADDADAGPARVSEHADPGAGTGRSPGAAGGPGPRPPASLPCCRPARRSPRPPCTRTTTRSPIRSARRAPNPTGTTGHRPRSARSAATAGSSRSSP